MSDVNNGGGHACVWAGGIWEISVPSTQFCCNPTTSLKKLGIFKNKKHPNAEIILYEPPCQ